MKPIAPDTTAAVEDIAAGRSVIAREAGPHSELSHALAGSIWLQRFYKRNFLVGQFEGKLEPQASLARRICGGDPGISVCYSHSALNLAPLMAMPAQSNNLRANLIVPQSELYPELVMTPGICVQPLVEVVLARNEEALLLEVL